MDKEKLIQLIPGTVGELNADALSVNPELYRGKVRDVLDLGDRLLIFTSDRISAFDRVLTTIPCKGEVLNTLALYWFDQTRDIMPNHVIKQVSPRSVLVKKCEIIPIEIIVRGYLTGSAWRDYSKGNPVSGIRLPQGMKNNQRFDIPLITPTTKAASGHDMPISREEIIQQRIVAPEIWAQVEKCALGMFDKATRLAASRGMILVDTKFEFGFDGDQLVCADEIFTPDSSRYWYLDTYQELFEADQEQRKLDKEYLRKWLMDRGFMGDGETPEIPDEVRAETAIRYIEAFENLTGRIFKPSEMAEEEELEEIARRIRES